ncbi:MAG: phage tail tube protein [Methanomicrobiales archaeon]|nr:phage tail tube protein [Methanomicrobiales archaeon]
MAVQFYSANDSSVLIGGTPLEGVQSIEWKVNRNRTDVPGFGTQERGGFNFGMLEITGKIRVKSTSNELDDKFFGKIPQESTFDMSVQLKRTSASQSLTANFKDCCIDHREITMDVNGVAIGVYTFSATTVEETA